MANGVNSSKPLPAVITGGVYNASESILVDGQAAAIQEDVNGNVQANIIVNQGGSEVPTSGKVGLGNSAKPTTSETVGGSYNATPVVLKDGQASAVQLDINGNLQFNVVIEV